MSKAERLTMSFLSRSRGFLAVAAVAASLSAARAAEAPLERLEIVTSSGAHQFQVEVARTEEQREKGLMERRSMPRDQGMLFEFHVEQPVAMWMKNTYIPLDMVFVSRRGRVTGIAENATPMSEEIIPSGQPAYAVIEFNAGVAREIKLKVGDDVRHPAFKR
jgi:uncharacterized protein